MFSRKSFKPASFSPLSWRFDQSHPPQPGPDIFPGPGVRQAPAKPRRRDRDDDALLFLLR